MRNNVIGIIAISFATVGALWGIGNLMNPEPDVNLPVEDVLLIAQRSTFNDTNPDVYVTVNVPTKLVVRNSDAVTHDLNSCSRSNYYLQLLYSTTMPLYLMLIIGSENRLNCIFSSLVVFSSCSG
jgi:hypothetical protein